MFCATLAAAAANFANLAGAASPRPVHKHVVSHSASRLHCLATTVLQCNATYRGLVGVRPNVCVEQCDCYGRPGAAEEYVLSRAGVLVSASAVHPLGHRLVYRQEWSPNSVDNTHERLDRIKPDQMCEKSDVGVRGLTLANSPFLFES